MTHNGESGGSGSPERWLWPDVWLSILEAERQEQIASYEGPFIPSGVKNCAGRWRFWEGQTIESVIADCKAFRNPRLHKPCPPTHAHGFSLPSVHHRRAPVSIQLK